PVLLDFEIGVQQAGHALESVDITNHRQGVHRMPGLKPLLAHGGPAYALATALRVVTVDAPYDACRQQITGRLTGHHADAQAHERTMPRVEADKKSTMTWMASCAAGLSCCRARIRSQSSSAFRLRRYSSLWTSLSAEMSSEV